MVGDILDIEKMDSGKFEVNRTYANINNVLSEECGYFKSIAEVKGIKLDLKLDQQINNSSFDPERIKQVISNLLSNALKYTIEGGAITVSTYRADNCIQVEVADTGVGIADIDKPHLFQKFAQTESHNHVRERGTGLGLYITKGIVEAHKGRVWIEDNKPKGSKFIFTLPMA